MEPNNFEKVKNAYREISELMLHKLESDKLTPSDMVDLLGSLITTFSLTVTEPEQFLNAVKYHIDMSLNSSEYDQIATHFVNLQSEDPS